MHPGLGRRANLTPTETPLFRPHLDHPRRERLVKAHVHGESAASHHGTDETLCPELDRGLAHRFGELALSQSA